MILNKSRLQKQNRGTCYDLQDFTIRHVSDEFESTCSCQQKYLGGGKQEYYLEKKYKNYSEKLRFSHPRVSNMLKYISKDCNFSGKRADERKELEM
ncbi:MAG: hypothetical protein LBL65_00840 [Campylobacteraceae bacterium]|jgi:hypothetical protein|nr:hypothetical protein [Campylobacteraceae bacterium]